MALQFKRGTTATLAAYVPLVGEPLWATNTNALYIGDGSTYGGILVTGGGGYSLPTASTSTLGGVKVDGSSITIDGNGIITAVGDGSSSTITNQLLFTTSSVTFADVTISTGNLNFSNNRVRIGAGATGNGSTDYIAVGISANASGSYSTAIGRQAKSTGINSLAIGTGAKADGAGSISIGEYAGTSPSFTVTNAANSIIINASGNDLNSTQSGFYVAPVRNSTSSNVVYYDVSTKEMTYGVASAINPFNQTLDTTSNVQFAGITATNITLAGRFTWNSTSSVVLGYGAVSNINWPSTGGVAIGASASVSGGGATAIGSNANASVGGALAIQGGSASSTNAIAIGPNSNASGQWSAAFGYNSLASGTSSQAFGFDARTSGDNSLALGRNSRANANNSIVLSASDSVYTTSTQSGFYVNPVRSSTSTDILYYDATTKEITYGTAPAAGNPFDQNLNTTSSVTFAGLTLNSEKILLGSGVTNSGSGAAIGIGQNAKAYDDAVAIGGGASAAAVGSISIGKNAKNTEFYAVQNAIVIATGGTNVNPTGSGFFVAPIQNSTASNVLYYNTSSKELTWGAPIAANPFDQSLNTTDSPTFAELTVGKSNTISSSLLGQTGTFVVDSIPVGDIRGVKYVIAMDNGTNMHLVEILAGTNGSNTYKTEYGVVTSDGELATFSTDINSGNFRLLASVVSGDLDLTFVRTKIVEL